MSLLIRSLILLVALGFPVSGWAAIALVAGNTVSSENDAAATTITTAAFTNNISTDNLLVAGCSSVTTLGTEDATVTDSAGNTWTRTESGPTYDATNGVVVTMYYARVTVGGGTKPTITCNFWTTTAHSVTASRAYRNIFGAEFSGAATTSILDKHGTNLQGPVDSNNVADFWKSPSSTVLPDANGQLVVGFAAQTNGGSGLQVGGSFNEGTGFSALTETVTVSPAGYVYNAEYQVQSTATSVQTTWTNVGNGTSTDTILSLMATFRVFSGGGGGPTCSGQLLLLGVGGC